VVGPVWIILTLTPRGFGWLPKGNPGRNFLFQLLALNLACLFQKQKGFRNEDFQAGILEQQAHYHHTRKTFKGGLDYLTWRNIIGPAKDQLVSRAKRGHLPYTGIRDFEWSVPQTGSPNEEGWFFHLIERFFGQTRFKRGSLRKGLKRLDGLNISGLYFSPDLGARYNF